MKVPKNWLAVLGISLSLPSTIFAIAFASFKLVDQGYISRFWGITLFLLVIINSFGLLIWHGTRKKN